MVYWTVVKKVAGKVVDLGDLMAARSVAQKEILLAVETVYWLVVWKAEKLVVVKANAMDYEPVEPTVALLVGMMDFFWAEQKANVRVVRMVCGKEKWLVVGKVAVMVPRLAGLKGADSAVGMVPSKVA